MDTENKKKHSIVVGMGPAGLTSALNLLILGHDVTLIDIRNEYALKQKVRIPQELIQQFYLYDFDETFLEKLVQKKYVCSLRKFQAYQLSILKDVYEKRKITSKKGISKEIVGKLVILKGHGAEISAIDGKTQSIVLKDNTEFTFDNLIDATGNKRHIANLLKSQSNGEYQIDYVCDLPQIDHQENAIIYFKAPVNKYLFKTPHNASNDYYLSEFTDNNWKKDRPPLYYIGANATKQKVYLMIEIPEELLNEPDHHKILAFAKPVLKQECEIDMDDLNIQATDLKIYSTFKLKQEITNIPYTILGRGGVCLVVGDALCPSNFHFGHGISKAVADGNNLSKVFKDNKFNEDQLKIRIKDIREEFKLETARLTTLNLKRTAELKKPATMSELPPNVIKDNEHSDGGVGSYLYDTFAFGLNRLTALFYREPAEKRKYEEQNDSAVSQSKKRKILQ